MTCLRNHFFLPTRGAHTRRTSLSRPLSSLLQLSVAEVLSGPRLQSKVYVINPKMSRRFVIVKHFTVVLKNANSKQMIRQK